MNKAAGLLVLFLAACGSADGGSASPEPGTETAGGLTSVLIPCDPADRYGNFTAHYDEQPGGTCGALPDAAYHWDDPNCGNSHDSYPPRGCTETRVYTCNNDPSITYTLELTEKDANDFSGTLSVAEPACQSDYAVTVTRAK